MLPGTSGKSYLVAGVARARPGLRDCAVRTGLLYGSARLWIVICDPRGRGQSFFIKAVAPSCVRDLRIGPTQAERSAQCSESRMLRKGQWERGMPGTPIQGASSIAT